MNINRHNYEEFFLLYVDNELSAAEKKAVDVFVKQNPDLQGELLLLQQTILKADDIVLDKKDWLFMEEEIPHLQESLLLYADDELIASDKKAVEVLLATDKAALAEWNILQQTKLQPDTAIVFADKRSLYRTEGSRVIAFKWWRVAAAAVLLGFGIWTGVSIYKNNFQTTTKGSALANSSKINSGQIKTAVPVNKTAIETQAKENTAVQHNTTVVTEKNQSIQPTENKIQPTEKINKQNTAEPKDNIAIKNSNKKPGNNLPESYLENINRKERNEIVSTNVLPEKNNITNSGVNNVIVKTNPNEKITSPVIAAIPVVYTGDENNNNRYLDIDDEKGKRTKLGGFLRKAKRMVERTTNIKTGDGLKVAGFEIALK